MLVMKMVRHPLEGTNHSFETTSCSVVLGHTIVIVLLGIVFNRPTTIGEETHPRMLMERAVISPMRKDDAAPECRSQRRHPIWNRLAIEKQNQCRSERDHQNEPDKNEATDVDRPSVR